MVGMRLLRSRRDVGIAAVILIIIAIAIGAAFDMAWFVSLQDFLNAHGGWTYAYLIGITVVASFVAWVHRHPYTIALALLCIVAVIGAAIAGNVIGA